MKDNYAFTITLLYIDLKFNPRLKKKILRSFEKYKENTKALFMRMKLKNKGLEDELEDQNNETGRLKSKLEREQENIDKIPIYIEEIRRVNVGLKTQLEEANRIEDVLKLELEENEKKNQKLEMEIIGLKKKIEKSKAQVMFNEILVILD